MANPIQIGWGVRSLASDKPVPITGQFYLRISQGNYSPVLASALVMEREGESAIFLSADMVSVAPEVLKKVKAKLLARFADFPVENIIINATHTHAGPSSVMVDTSSYPNKLKYTPTEEMREFISTQMADAIWEAWENRKEGAIAYGYGFATTGHSRRSVYLEDTTKGQGNAGFFVNGRAIMYGNTNNELFDGYEAGTDSFINLLYTFDAQGKLTGAVINVPCPSQTNEHAWSLHAGFWHNVREKLEAKYGNIGIVSQSAAAGDLSPRQLHYNAAEVRRYQLKYGDKIAEYMKNPMPFPPSFFSDEETARSRYMSDAIELMRSEDIAERITCAFDEVLSWAKKDMQNEPELKHEVREVKLSRRLFPKELLEQEIANSKELEKKEFLTEGNDYALLMENSRLVAGRRRVEGVIKRAAIQEEEPCITTAIHAVRVGNIAFASNRFELYMDYMHRIQARSPFEQTFIVQLTVDENGCGSYLATEKGIANKGYSASPYCNQVSPKGGQELVNETLALLKEMKK